MGLFKRRPEGTSDEAQGRASASQAQRAGAGSLVSQAGRDVVINVYVAQEYLANSRDAILAREISAEALPVAIEKSEIFDAALVQRLSDSGNLQTLAQPSYQLALNRSRIAAGASESDEDIERLVELMDERADHSSRLARASVDQAVQIIDRVDEESLRALTLYQGAIAMIRTTNTENALGFLDDWDAAVFKVLPEVLPLGQGWLEHLHILGAVRLDTTGAKSLLPMHAWLLKVFPAFFNPAIAPESLADIIGACAEHLDYRVAPQPPLREHELVPSSYRIAITGTSERFAQFYGGFPVEPSQIESVLTTLRQKGALGSADTDALASFRDQIARRENLARYDAWRSQIPHPVNITHVGKALVWASMRRLGLEVMTFQEMLEFG